MSTHNDDTYMISDEELLRKLAEMNDKVWSVHNAFYIGSAPDFHPWNPLTNWSDCALLQERLIRDGWLIVFLKNEGIFMLSSRKHNKTVQDPDLKRAICLAVIASEV